ncbi:hypothetical protein [Nonomuraea basaltis]|uniref:hypothetical protein n=1 Tax=Nonomuraea basaltis TaxID=2495887 RepID=UPI00110C4CA0|nr:hypothetical protein [Nonomuraea basaltis]TMR97868.1 hypothetical protein EJK15_16115 [Nonomuraea basaltis]
MARRTRRPAPAAAATRAGTTALLEWLKHWNENARPFTWTKGADQIISAIGRYCARISGPRQ